MTRTTLYAPDIECEGCAVSIRKALARTPGVEEVDVDVAAKTVHLALTQNNPAPAIAALDAAGFSSREAAAPTVGVGVSSSDRV